MGRLAISLATSLFFHVLCCWVLYGKNVATYSFVSGRLLHANLVVVKRARGMDGKVRVAKFLEPVSLSVENAVSDKHGRGVEFDPPNEGDQSGGGNGEYVPVEKLSKRPFPLTDFEVPNLQDFDIESEKERLVLRVWIDSLGNVEHAELLEVTSMGQASQAIVEGYKKMRFSPGEVNGRAVGCVLLIEVMLEEALLGGGQ